MPVPSTEHTFDQRMAFRRLFIRHVLYMIGVHSIFYPTNMSTFQIPNRQIVEENGRVKYMTCKISHLRSSQRLKLKQQIELYLNTPILGVMPISDTIMDGQELVIYAKSLEQYHVRIIFLFLDKMPVPTTPFSIDQRLAFNREFLEQVDEMLGFFKDEISERETRLENGKITKMIFSISNLSSVQREELRRTMDCYLDVPIHVQMPISDTSMDERRLIIYAKSLEYYHVSIIVLFFRHDHQKPFSPFCNAKTRIYFNIHV